MLLLNIKVKKSSLLILFIHKIAAHRTQMFDFQWGGLVRVSIIHTDLMHKVMKHTHTNTNKHTHTHTTHSEDGV